tara:strand:- start:694 stop:843 length:150 start_codon:yes stop_codon:yes gene_type:complete
MIGYCLKKDVSSSALLWLQSILNLKILPKKYNVCFKIIKINTVDVKSNI